MVVCRISLLDGTTFEPKGIDKNSTGQVVFNKVSQHLDLIETDYFALTFRDKTGKKHWIDNTKKITDQVKGGTWVFEFQVKFYPPDPQSLKEDITRYQLCLQVRVDIFNGRLPCSFVTYALLGSYTVQAELGDYIQAEYAGSIDYLKDFDFAPSQNLELLEKIAELHKYHKGQHPEEAESNFLDNAKRLAMYGVDLHDVKDQENKPLVLGICASGILVYKDRLRINRFVWPKILKLEYKRNFFYVQIRPGILEPKEKTVGFRLDNHKLAKRLWKICVEHHAFFRLKDMEGGDTGTLFPRFNTKFRYSGRTQAQAKKAAEAHNRQEPHIARTAERRSINKAKPLDMDEMKRSHPDERDMYDKKKGDPSATAGLGPHPDQNNLDQDGKQKRAPGEEDRLKQDFFQLLNETPDVGRHSRWNDVKHKIDKDPRYKAVGSNPQREEWFNEYIKNLGLKEDFMNLLKETPGIDRFSLWNNVKPTIESDPRYQAVPNDSMREKWFDEYVKSLEDKLKADFMQLLNDTPDINRHSKWGDVKHRIDRDPRYQAVGSSPLREDWFDEYIRNLGVKEDFMQMLKDTPDITRHSRWNDVKPKVEKDPRYQAVNSNPQRERWFNDYIRGLEDGAAAKGKKDKEEEKRRKKEEEKRKKDEEKEKLKQDFFQLLNDTPDVGRQSRWNDVKHKIDKDPRYKAVGSNPQREEWFNEYIKNLGLKHDFMNLLKDTPDIDRFSLWNDVQPMIESDPRYQAVPSDSMRKKWFDEYIKGLEDKLKADFMQLLNDTPDINRHSKWGDVKHRIDRDPRYQAVGSSPLREDWFDEYVKNIGVKEDFMQMLKDTPDITRHSRWNDVKPKVEKDPRYQAVNSNSRRERWFNDYIRRLEDQLKADFMQLLHDTPDINRHSKWGDVKHKIDSDPRYKAVDSNSQREDWFKEHVKHMGLKDDFMQLLKDTPDIDRHSKWGDVKHKVDTDPRYIAVDSSSRRERWFNEYKRNLDDEEKKAAEDATKKYETDLDVILAGKGAVNKDLEEGGKKGKGEDKGKGKKGDSFKEKKGGLFGKFGKKSPTKKEKDGDFPPPPSPLSDQDLMQQKKAGMMWALPGIEELKERQESGSQGGLALGDYGMRPGDDKSIDRKQQFMPVVPPTVEIRDRKGYDRMPFFEPAGESDDSRKGPPPIAKKPKAPGGYDSEEDRLLRASGEIDASQLVNSPPTVKTSSFKYTPNLDEPPMSTSNIPIVETKTHTVTYEKDGVPFDTEDSILISAHSYTTKSQTIDTTTYKTERNGVIETRVERKITVTSDEMDDIDHDALLRAAIEEVTNMNPDLSVERIECIKQIEGEK